MCCSRSLPAILSALFRGANWFSMFLDADGRRDTNSLISLACGCPLSVPSNLSTMSLALCIFNLNYNTNQKDLQIWHTAQGREHRRQESQKFRSSRSLLRTVEVDPVLKTTRRDF